MEQRIVGAWSWPYLEGWGRIDFRADHTLAETFPPDPMIVESGSWHVADNVLVQELDNHLMVEWWRGGESERPRLQKRIVRHRITKIDDTKMWFDDGSWLTRRAQ
jgi:hypothetical protein